MQIIDGIPVWGDPVDKNALTQIKVSARTASKAALMADHHKGYTVPIGGVLAYENAVSPSGVGYDIGCGNKAVRLNINLNDRAGRRAADFDRPAVMDKIYSNLSFGVGRINDRAPDHALFDDPAWKIVPQFKEMARQQLGTIGSGNHYVDLFCDEDGWVWIGVHFGSRGLGHKTATQFLKEGGAKDGDVEPLVLQLGTALGDDYMEAMRLAGLYAYAGRDWVCAEVARLLGAEIIEEVHNHHNYAWREVHADREYIVVRKGATPAFPGQKGFIGGSMGEAAVIVEGVEHPDHALDFYSTVHGAGRVMSRTAAKGKKARSIVKMLPGGIKEPVEVAAVPGKISREDMDGWLRTAGVELRGADVDEAPQAYKRLPEVLGHHANGIKILHTLTPIGVAMAGPREHDPFKD